MPSIAEPVPLMLDRERHLHLDMAAMLLAERELSRIWGKKISLFTVIAGTDGLGLNDISVLLWVSLLHEDPSMTLLKTQDLMNLSHIGDYTTAIFAAWNVAWPPVPVEDDGETAPLARTSTGDASGVPAGSSWASVTTSSGT